MSYAGQMIRWVARFFAAIVGVLAFVVFVGKFAGGINLKLPNITLANALLRVFDFIAWIGLFIGFFRERLGGFLILGGVAAYFLTAYIVTGTFPSGLFFLYMILPGVLYLLSYWINARKSGVMEPNEPVSNDEARNAQSAG